MKIVNPRSEWGETIPEFNYDIRYHNVFTEISDMLQILEFNFRTRIIGDVNEKLLRDIMTALNIKPVEELPERLNVKMHRTIKTKNEPRK